MRAPFHQLGVALEFLRLLSLGVVVEEAGDDFRRCRLDLSGVNRARRAIDREEVTFVETLARDRRNLPIVIDLNARRAADADLSHLPRDERRVGRDAATRGE